MSKIILKEHQERAGERLKDPNNPGLLLYWNLGSGKTIGAISAAKKLNTKATVVVPASLQENFKKEIAVTKENPKNFSVQSYDKFTRNPNLTNNGLLILDEAHKLRTSSSNRSMAVQNAAKYFDKKLLLTGTPIQNSPEEISPLINTITGTHTLPVSSKEFKEKYISKQLIVPSLWDQYVHNKPIKTKIVINHERDFRNKIKGLIDYYDSQNPTDYPKVSEHTVDVPMTRDQVKFYNYYEKKLPKSLRAKMVNMLPPDKNETMKLNAFLSATRQLSNTSGGFLKTPSNEVPLKVKTIADYVQKDNKPAVIYSNYLESGLNPISQELTKRKIPHGVFTGSLNSAEKNDLVKAYNSKKIKALLISSSGGEGIDLKHTGSVHIMEPHWNDPKIEQVIGRAARYHSHYDLPEADRHVNVFRYISKFEEPDSFLFPNKRRVSADQYLTNLSKQKKEVNGLFLNILKEEGTKEMGFTKTALLAMLLKLTKTAPAAPAKKKQPAVDTNNNEGVEKVSKFFKTPISK